jgi:hypothetical protein
MSQLAGRASRGFLLAEQVEPNGLADHLRIERVYTSSRKAMKQALRVVLGLPPQFEGEDDDRPDPEEDQGSTVCSRE